MSDRLFMETTKISASRTAAQIAERLGAAGASAILTEYGKDRKIEALNFQLLVNGRTIPFRLPIRVQAVKKLLAERRARYAADDEKAERIAWRQVYRWIEAQIALAETGMVKMEEVFLPYLQVSATETIFQRLEASNFKALPAPEERT